jgi:hypothetical protein
MKTKEFIYKGVENYLKSNMSANRFSVVAIAEDMPTFEGFIIPYYFQMIEGVPFPGGHRRTVHQFGGLRRTIQRDCNAVGV